jgi:hypothetical protein
MFDASPQVVHAPMTPSQNTSMLSMSFMEVDPPINTNTPLARIIILELDTQ